MPAASSSEEINPHQNNPFQIRVTMPKRPCRSPANGPMNHAIAQAHTGWPQAPATCLKDCSMILKRRVKPTHPGFLQASALLTPNAAHAWQILSGLASSRYRVPASASAFGAALAPDKPLCCCCCWCWALAAGGLYKWESWKELSSISQASS